MVELTFNYPSGESKNGKNGWGMQRFKLQKENLKQL